MCQCPPLSRQNKVKGRLNSRPLFIAPRALVAAATAATAIGVYVRCAAAAAIAAVAPAADEQQQDYYPPEIAAIAAAILLAAAAAGPVAARDEQ